MATITTRNYLNSRSISSFYQIKSGPCFKYALFQFDLQYQPVDEVFDIFSLSKWVIILLMYSTDKTYRMRYFDFRSQQHRPSAFPTNEKHWTKAGVTLNRRFQSCGIILSNTSPSGGCFETWCVSGRHYTMDKVGRPARDNKSDVTMIKGRDRCATANWPAGTYSNKHKRLNQRWINVAPASQTLAQQ